MRSPSPYAYTPFALAGRYALHPARQVTHFMGLRRLITRYRPDHAHAQLNKGALFLKQTINDLAYTSSDQLARNPVQYTRLLAFSVNVQKILGLRRQKPSMGLITRAEAGVASKTIQKKH
jgi:hypothetical protein